MEKKPTENKEQPIKKEQIQQEHSGESPSSKKLLTYLAATFVLLLILGTGSYLYSQYKKENSTATDESISPPPQKQTETTDANATTSIPTAEEFTEAQIAYLSDCDGFGKGDTWILDTVTQTNKQITDNGKNTTPKWSPDGKKLAWIEEDKNIKIYNYGTGSIFYLLDTYNLENMSIVDRTEELRKQKLLELHSFDWSPDSTQIAYSRNGVWIKDLETKEEKQILKPYLEKNKVINDPLPNKVWDLEKGSYVYENLGYSPNGAYLLFTKTFLMGEEYNIYQLADGEIINIIEKTALQPNHISWSPDSSKILYSGECGGWLGGTHYYTLKTKETKTIHNEGTISSYWLNNKEFITIKSNIENECFPGQAGFKLAVLDLEGDTLNTLIPKIEMSKHFVFSKGTSTNKKWILIGAYKLIEQAVSIENGNTVEFNLETSEISWRP